MMNLNTIFLVGMSFVYLTRLGVWVVIKLSILNKPLLVNLGGILVRRMVACRERWWLKVWVHLGGLVYKINSSYDDGICIAISCLRPLYSDRSPNPADWI